MPEVPDTVDVALDALSSPTSDEVSAATEGFSAREIAAAGAARALGGGGSTLGAVRRLSFSVDAAADCAAGPVSLYTPDVGELVGPVYLRDAIPPDNQAIVVGRDETVTDDADHPPLAEIDTSTVLDSFAQAAQGDAVNAVPTTTGPVTVGYSDTTTGNPNGNPNVYPWQTEHVYDGSYGSAQSGQLIIEAGHLWTADPIGTSGGVKPDFAGNVGGTVTDGDDIVWTDNGPATGGATILVDVFTPGP